LQLGVIELAAPMHAHGARIREQQTYRHVVHVCDSCSVQRERTLTRGAFVPCDLPQRSRAAHVVTRCSFEPMRLTRRRV
jgi:hypothetical protein